jgi:hypothetical protein
MNWGKSIIIAFVLFAGFIATLVTVCMRQDVNLVSKDYYQEELAYQEQILRMDNLKDLDQKPVIQRSGNFIEVEFKQFNQIKNGQMKLFSPSDPGKDKLYLLRASESNKQYIAVDDVAKGMYRARMQWEMNGKEYYIETVVNI